MLRIPIRTRLAVALAVPLLALLLRTGFEVARHGDRVGDLEHDAALARVATAPLALVDSLHDERTRAVVDLAGPAGLGRALPDGGRAEARDATDRARAALEARLGGAAPALAATFAPALDGLDALDAVRARVDAERPAAAGAEPTARARGAEDASGAYAALAEPFLVAAERIVRSIGDAPLRHGAELAVLAGRTVAQHADLSLRLLLSAVAPGDAGPGEVSAAATSRARWEADTARITTASAPYDGVVRDHFPADAVAAVTDLSAVLVGGPPAPAGELAGVVDAPGAGLRELRAALVDEVEAVAAHLAGEARGQHRAFVAMVGVTLAAAAALTWVVALSVTTPLRSLARRARTVARDGLPAALVDVLRTPLGRDVDVPAAPPARPAPGDDVAGAITTVHDSALDLAVEQALLRRNLADGLVSLGRRHHDLVARQLDLISRLENAETDPDSLANLFRLDHLATRMRRSAESLLVLAGVEPPRRRAAPLPLTDVVRAAVGEVEDYRRVTVRGVEPATVAGTAAADLAHLLAELIENALVVSPPDRPVVVRGRRLVDATYAVTVSDAGPEMDHHEIETANRRLAGLECLTVAPSRYLGHHVAGHLAARHGISVHLIANPGGPGTIATVTLPERLAGRHEVPAPAELPPPPAAGAPAAGSPPGEGVAPAAGSADPRPGPATRDGAGTGEAPASPLPRRVRTPP